MHVFYGDPWKDKVNFVDDNNVVVGYDMGQQCCEHADWWIQDTDIVTSSLETQPDNEFLQGYSFDIEYCKDDTVEATNQHLDRHNIVIFKLLHTSKPPLYLVLSNCHNGYYSHGFVMTVPKIKYSGYV